MKNDSTSSHTSALASSVDEIPECPVAEIAQVQISSIDEYFEVLEPQAVPSIYGGSASPLETAYEPAQKPVLSPKFVPLPKRDAAPQWSSALQNLLDQPPSKLPLHVAASGFLFCCAFTAWAWLGQIQDVSRAQGRLVPQGEVYKVQPVTQGEITQITVKEGQFVNAGQVIAVLDNRLAEAEVNRLQQSLGMYRLQLMQTQGLIERARLEARTRQLAAQAQMRAQKAAIAQAQSSAATHQQLLTQIERQTEAYSERVGRLEPLVAEGALAHEQLFSAEQALQEQQQMGTQKQGEFAQARGEIERLQAELVQIQAEASQGDLELQQQVQRLELEASQVQAKYQETETLLRAAQTKLTQMYLFAPISGTISALNMRNSGEVAQPGETFAEIAPEGMPLVLSAAISTQEAGFVNKGMPVRIKFDAFPYQEFGTVEGRVISISPDSAPNSQQELVYRVEIGLDQTQISKDGQPVELKAGQTAKAEIVTRQRRIIEVLLDPIQKLQQGGLSL